MRSKKILALVLLNVALLATLCVPNLLGPSSAQALPAVPRPSEYLMASGEVVGGNSGVVFVIDTKNPSLTVFALDPTTKKMDAMPPIDLKRYFK